MACFAEAEMFARVRSQGQWWEKIVAAIQRELSNHLGVPSTNYQQLREQMEQERQETARLCEKSLESLADSRPLGLARCKEEDEPRVLCAAARRSHRGVFR